MRQSAAEAEPDASFTLRLQEQLPAVPRRDTIQQQIPCATITQIHPVTAPDVYALNILQACSRVRNVADLGQRQPDRRTWSGTVFGPPELFSSGTCLLAHSNTGIQAESRLVVVSGRTLPPGPLS